MTGQLTQSKKSSNKKLVAILLGLVIIGIIYTQFKKKETLPEDQKKEKNPIQSALNNIQTNIPKIPGFN